MHCTSMNNELKASSSLVKCSNNNIDVAVKNKGNYNIKCSKQTPQETSDYLVNF